jgi:hypothetical protein
MFLCPPLKMHLLVLDDDGELSLCDQQWQQEAEAVSTE